MTIFAGDQHAVQTRSPLVRGHLHSGGEAKGHGRRGRDLWYLRSRQGNIKRLVEHYQFVQNPMTSQVEVYDVEADNWSYEDYSNVDARGSGPSVPRDVFDDNLNGGNGTSVGFFLVTSNGNLYENR